MYMKNHEQIKSTRVAKVLPKEAVWNVVTCWDILFPPAITVFSFPSPMNITFVFFLPTFKLSSSYLSFFHYE